MMRNSILFIILLLSNSVLASLPVCHPDYDEWVAVGMPASWAIPRQCKGDTDGLAEGDPWVVYVYYQDQDVLNDAFKVKEPPEGPGIASIVSNGTEGIAADFDHRQAGSPYVGYYRVGTTDACILQTYWGYREPPDGVGVSPDCDQCETPGSGLQGPQLSFRVSRAGGAFYDSDVVLVDPGTVLQIGIINTTPDTRTYYDAYVSVTDGQGNGAWTGSNWVDNGFFRWSYFGTSPIANKDTWYVKTISALFGFPTNPSGITSSVEYMYTGDGNVTVELYNEFFELADTLTIQPFSTSGETPSITVVSPNGGEQLPAGGAFDIEWESTGSIFAVKIEYSITGDTWQTITGVTDNTGIYIWDPIPFIFSTNGTIRISDTTYPPTVDSSDNSFVFYDCTMPTTPSVDLDNNCYVNLKDLAIFCENWLLCGNQFDPACGS